MNAKTTRTAGRPTRRPAPRPKGWRRFFTRKRILLTLLGLFLAGVAVVAVAWVAIGVPVAERAGRGPGLDHLLRRRQDRDGPDRRGRRQPRVGAAVEGARSRCSTPCSPPRTATSTRTPASAPTGIGRAVVAALKRRRRPRAWLDDHPAVRQELLPHPGPDADPQGQGDHHLAQDRPAEVQGPDPRATTSTPSTTAAAPTASRPRPRPTSARTSPSSRVARVPLLASVIRGPSLYDPALGAKQKAERRRPGSTTSSTGMVSRGLADPGPARQGDVPRHVALGQGHGSKRPGSIGYITDGVQQELQHQAQADRRRHRPRRPADHHDDQQAGARTPPSRPSRTTCRPGPGTSTLQAGLAAIKPGDGAIVAMYGGEDFQKTSSTRPPTRRCRPARRSSRSR